MEAGSENPTQIPFIDFATDPRVLEPGSEGWNLLCKEVRVACEDYGCFQLAYDGLPLQLHQDMFQAMKTLFDLPVETKRKNFNPKPYHGYIGGSDVVPLYESLGLEDAHNTDAARAFTDLMWPDGNPSFCHTINSMGKKMRELEFIVRKMILDSYGVGNYFDSMAENSCTVFRVMNYKAPPSHDSAIGLVPHTDKNILTLLCQDDVQGLQVLSKTNQWIQLTLKKGSFAVLVGETLKAWSNGRAHPVKHRVVMSGGGGKERFSFGLFSMPQEEATVQVPQELVDEEHPLKFRPFNYLDFVSFVHSDKIAMNKDDALEIFAGLRLKVFITIFISSLPQIISQCLPKKKNFSPSRSFGYVGGSDMVPSYESLGLEEAPELEAARAFTDLIWPDGN